MCWRTPRRKQHRVDGLGTPEETEIPQEEQGQESQTNFREKGVNQFAVGMTCLSRLHYRRKHNTERYKDWYVCSRSSKE